jgi:RNA ligase
MSGKVINSNYGSIFHLPGSKMSDERDRACNDGHVQLLTVKSRQRKDWSDTIIVMEKLDGANCGVLKQDGKILAVSRTGHLLNDEPGYEHYRLFHKWVMSKERVFSDILSEGERIVFENLSYTHSIRYHLEHIPFVAIDLFSGKQRQRLVELKNRIGDEFPMPTKLYQGPAAWPVLYALKDLEMCEYHCLGGDRPEGVVYRLEFDSREKGDGVEFLAKYVRPDFVPGKFLTKNGPVLKNTYVDPF